MLTNKLLKSLEQRETVKSPVNMKWYYMRMKTVTTSTGFLFLYARYDYIFISITELVYL